MDRTFYSQCVEQSLKGAVLPDQACLEILSSSKIELLPLLDAAFQVRKTYTGQEVMVHIINNAQNGFCPEDCHYCAQAKTSKADIAEYPLKSDEEIFAEAKRAYEGGAFRYCMVFAGRGPSPRRVEKLAELVAEIKKRYPIQVCVSAGLINDEGAQKLKQAGLDRLNHNLNTSEKNYPNICTTHTYQDRLNTLQSAQKAGIQLCSGLILGMGEAINDIVEVAKTLRSVKAKSIPVNFLIPIEGNTLKTISKLTPEFCLRVLCLFRFLNPDSELRVAAGREGHLRSMEVMSLYPANSLFLDGYLNTKGASRARTLRMIKDAGFTIKSKIPLEELLEKEEGDQNLFKVEESTVFMKDLNDLRPQLVQPPACSSTQKQ